MLSIIIPNNNEPELEEIVNTAFRCFPESQIIVTHDLSQRGKGWAIRNGLKEAAGDVIAFLDADMDIHPRMITRLLPFLVDYDIVVGTKGIEKGLLKRRILTHLSRAYIRILFGLKVDTQTGIKLFKRPAIQEWETDGFAFDLEILYKAKKKGFTMVEVPIDATIRKGILWKAILRTLKETIKLRLSVL